MSTLVNLMQPMLRPGVVERPVEDTRAPATASPAKRGIDRFAEEQIRRLVRELFIGRPKPARHVVFSAVDERTYIAELCMDVAKTLAAQVAGSVCVIEANPRNPELESVFGTGIEETSPRNDGYGSLRRDSQHISGKLWLAPLKLLLDENPMSSAWLERRLADFRLEFDYTIVHAPPAGVFGEAALLGQLSDGLALVLEAHSTRRVAAQKAKEMLQAANVRMLGAVLSERRFPIPDEIYKRL